MYKTTKDKNQRAFIRGSWSDSGEEDDEKAKDETCLVAQASNEICLEVNLEPDKWIKDSRCSKHMTGNRKLFSTYKAYNEGNVIFGSNLHGNIIRKGKICDNKCSITFSEHDSEITKDDKVIEFCNANGITHNFSAPRTPQSDGVVERKNRTLQEMSRIMLNEQSLPKKYWFNAVDTSTYILNRIRIRAILGYSQNSKAYIILNKHTMKIKESLNVTFDENPLPSKTSPLVDDDLDEEEAIKVTKKKKLEDDIEDKILEINKVVNIKESRNHTLENVIGNLNKRTLRNKLHENGVVSRNKARLESIRILLAYACALDFKLLQMDIKSAFLNGLINEEVYVAQPLGFIDFEKPDHVYKLKKALYGIKQAPKAWYDRLKAFLIKHEYKMRMDPKTSHLEAVKRIFRYIKGTTHLGLWYPKGTDIETVVYADSDHEGDYMDRKSTSGICTFVGCCLASWFSKEQIALSMSTSTMDETSSHRL
nr:hypothetical protein [Tanacetum cinerariifolium]